MDTILLILGLLLMIGGIIGSFIPVLPGPPMSWVGLLLLYFTDAVDFNYWLLGITFVLTVIITILDFVIPAQGTKRFGGSKYGIWGTNIGLVVGIFTPIPFAFIIGPFLGALIGELIYNSSDHKRALKAATGSFLGFLASTFVNFVFCMILFGIFVAVVWTNAGKLF
ncbi:DUF456 domain-containing protein [Flavobacterium sp.]|uniref:DUF456 domain-containing protein n=1 Tax=Flavobacterium sp. TaxID=239 RepID=UPI0025BD70CD|nr:DUF456 domain-containing protein [Flavobacterium sp.]